MSISRWLLLYMLAQLLVPHLTSLTNCLPGIFVGKSPRHFLRPNQPKTKRHPHPLLPQGCFSEASLPTVTPVFLAILAPDLTQPSHSTLQVRFLECLHFSHLSLHLPSTARLRAFSPPLGSFNHFLTAVSTRSQCNLGLASKP